MWTIWYTLGTYFMVYSEANELGKEGASEPCFYKHWISHGTFIKTFPHQPSSKLKMFHLPLWWSLVVGMYLRQKGKEETWKNRDYQEHFMLCVCVHACIDESVSLSFLCNIGLTSAWGLSLNLLKSPLEASKHSTESSSKHSLLTPPQSRPVQR